MENVKLDLIPGRVMPICHASQYDAGRVIRFNLVENDVPYVLDGTETVTFGERKIDGNVVTAACVVTATKSYVDLETTEQMCACYGQNLCELKIEKGDVLIGTLNFVLDVERDPLDGGIQSQSEIYNLQAQIDEIIQQELENYDIYGAYVTEQTSGAVANFTDGADNVPVKALSVEFAATQASGTPTPSAPIPIVGVDKVNITRTGKNLLDNTAFNTYSNWKDDIVTVGNMSTSISNKGFIIPTKSGVTYTISFGISAEIFPTYLYLCKTNRVDTSTRIAYITTNTLQNQSYTFTADDSLYYLRMGNTNSEAYFSGQIAKISYAQLEVNNQATVYEPYNGTTALINLGGTYYGGYIDVVTGKITLTHKRVKMSDLSWIGSNGNFENRTSSEDLHTATRGTPTMCSIYQSSGNASSVNMLDKSIQTMGGAGSSNFWVKDTDYSTKEAFIASLGNAEIVYELETPLVVYASNTAEIPTILGVNNIFSDAGDVDVTYRADTALYIDKRLNA